MAGNPIIEADNLEGHTKTDAGRRRVALDDRAVAALVARQIAQDAGQAAWGPAYRNLGAVLHLRERQPLKPQYVTRQFDRLHEQAGLPEMTFHGLRHQ